MKLLLSLFVFSVVVATLVESQWFAGNGGISKYDDAGEYDLPPPSARIVGGIEARPNEFPWQCSVRRKATNGHFCGCSVINERWIITAAHCMEGETPAIVSIVVGDHTRSAANPARQTLDVDSIYMHEQYDNYWLYNDISLVKVATDIDLNENVWPILEPTPADQYVSRKSQTCGWGSQSFGGSCCPDTLRYTTVNITTNDACQIAYGNEPVTADMICATDNQGSNDRDSCQGDSGGPLSVKNADGTFELVGIVSWGFGCASGWPGVYCRVGYFYDWIQDKLDNN